MAKTTESKTQKQSTPAAAPVAAPAPAAAASTPKKGGKKETAAPTPVAAPASTPAPVAESAVVVEQTEVSAPAETSDESLSGTGLIIRKMQSQISELTSQIQASTAALKILTTAMKTLDKEYSKERKEYMKKIEKNTRKSKGSRNPGGFNKAAKISVELADFLELPHDTLLARTDATRRINKYIKDNNLQNPTAKTEILCDDKLKALLQPGNDVVRYFNLQRYLKKHFVSSVAAPAPAAVA
jgi:chromatin remodeling complex protein RSC6